MKTLKLSLFTFSIIFTLQMMAQDDVDRIILEEKGFRLSSDIVSKNFSLMRQTPTEEYLTNYIDKVGDKVSVEDAAIIAQSIIKVSECFKIDPWVLTGLLQKESSFRKDAVSGTNAAGLTQFTTSGFREVNDQLGFHGIKGGTLAAQAYFNTQITTCIDPNWIHLWIRVALPETDENFINNSKEELKKDVLLAVTYGAILLKTYVAFVDDNAVEPAMSETYFKALQLYNGEPGQAKIDYAKEIFKNLQALYPIPVTFSFLD